MRLRLTMKSVLRCFAVAQHVARTWYRVDELALESVVYLSAEPVHVHVNDVAARLEIIVPGGLKQH